MPDITIPKPTSSHILWGGAVEIHCFGKGQNWSLAGRTPHEADWNNPGIRYRLYQMAKRYGASRIYAPNPSQFNGQIAHTDEFDLDWAGGKVFRGPFTDGVLLTEPNTAFAVSSADCPTVVLNDSLSGGLVAAHAGFRSLIPDEHGGRTLLHRMSFALDTYVSRISQGAFLRGFIACGIGESSYRFLSSDKGFTDRHREACEWVERCFRIAIRSSGSGWYVDLAELVRAQLEIMAVGKEYVGFDGACTSSDIDCHGNPLWHSNRRGDKTRNLVLVIRR